MNVRLKLIFILTALLTCVLTSTAIAHEMGKKMDYNITVSKADVIYKYMLFVIETKRISMEAVIEFAKELGKDTHNLTLYKNKFLVLKDELENATKERNYKKIRNITKEMKEVVAKFRNECRKIFGNETTEVKERIEVKLKENEEYLNSLLKEARITRMKRNIELFDLAIKKAENIINKLEKRGINMTDARIILDEIKEKRERFIELMNKTIEACTGYGIGKCKPENVSEVREYLEFKKDIIKEFKELKRKIYELVLEYYIQKGLRTVENFEKSLNKLEKNLDVSEEKAKVKAMKDLLKSAKHNFEKENYEKAVEILKSVKESFKEVKESIKSKKMAKKHHRGAKK